jgi:hypothetical protein
MDAKFKKKAEHLANSLLTSIQELQNPIIIESNLEGEQLQRIDLEIKLLDSCISQLKVSNNNN